MHGKWVTKTGHTCKSIAWLCRAVVRKAKFWLELTSEGQNPSC